MAKMNVGKVRRICRISDKELVQYHDEVSDGLLTRTSVVCL